VNGAHRRAAWLVGAAALALTTAALVYDPRAEAADPKRVLGLVVAAAAFAFALLRRRPRAPYSWAARAGALFVATSGASFAWGLPSGARDLGVFVGAVGAGVLAAHLGRRLGIRLVRTTALATGTLAASAAVASALVLGHARGMAIHAGQGNPNWLGLLLGVTLPLALDAAHAWRGRPRLLASVGAAVQVVGLALSHSRVGWVAGFVACALLLAAWTRGKWTRRVGAVAAVAAFVLGMLLLAPRQASATDADTPVDLAFRGRAWIWHGAARAAMASGPFGAGLGRFGHAYLEAQGKELARTTPQDAARRFVNATTAHEELLQAAVESGPLAALLLVWTILLGVRAHRRAGWLGGAAAMAAVGIACLGDSPLRQPAIALLFGLLLGVPATDPDPDSDSDSDWRRLRARAPALLGLVAVAWLLVPATRTWLSTRERTRAVTLAPDVALVSLAKAARIDPGSGEAALALGLHRLALGDAAGALPELTRADRLVADTGARIAMGSARLALEDHAGAERDYRGALTYDPGSFRARVGLAQAEMARGDLDGAEREATIARRLLPGDPRGLELTDRIHERRMDLPAAE
jgi:tetratricopeptide (TPR) repeat protein